MILDKSLLQPTKADKLALKILKQLREKSRLKDRCENSQSVLSLYKKGDGYYVLYKVDQAVYRIATTEAELIRNGERVILITICQDCIKVTRDDYMLNHGIWQSIARDSKGLLCLSCVESKLGPILPDMVDMTIPTNIATFPEFY